MTNAYIKFLNDLFLAIEDTLDEAQRKGDVEEEYRLLSQLEVVGEIIKKFQEIPKETMWAKYIKEYQEEASKDHEYIITLHTIKDNGIYISPNDIIEEKDGILYIENIAGKCYINCYDIVSVSMELG